MKLEVVVGGKSSIFPWLHTSKLKPLNKGAIYLLQLQRYSLSLSLAGHCVLTGPHWGAQPSVMDSIQYPLSLWNLPESHPASGHKVMYVTLLPLRHDHQILQNCWFSLSPSVSFPGVQKRFHCTPMSSWSSRRHLCQWGLTLPLKTRQPFDHPQDVRDFRETPFLPEIQWAWRDIGLLHFQILGFFFLCFLPSKLSQGSEGKLQSELYFTLSQLRDLYLVWVKGMVLTDLLFFLKVIIGARSI